MGLKEWGETFMRRGGLIGTKLVIFFVGLVVLVIAWLVGR